MATELIASRLRAERARVNLTLREVGKLTGVHYVSISRYEQGKMPTLDALLKLATLYGVKPGDLLPETVALPGRKPNKKP